MREVVLESRACGVCGADAPGGRVGVVVESDGACDGRRGGTFFLGPVVRALWVAPRERSGLAYAAGYAAVLYLFRYSFLPLKLSSWWPAWTLGTALVLLFSLLAPLALALAFAAGVSLDRAPEKSGRLPALFALLVGWFGSYTLLFLLDEVWQWLAAAAG